MKGSWGPRRRSWIKRGTKPLPARNPERQAKRRKRYQAVLHSARFRKLRLEAFQRDGWRCTEEIEGQRCPVVDESQTGTGLIAEHTSYARFGRELLEDLRTRCTSCDRRGTPQERANHANGFTR